MTSSESQNQVSARHQAFVDHLKNQGFLASPSVEAAFRHVPRHLFLPGVALDKVYRNQVIPILYVDGQLVSSASQPAMMAIMLHQLQLQPGQRVLEIGTGTGYNAALMTHIVGDAGRVVSLDIDADLVDSARQHLEAADLEHVHVVYQDGGFGYPAAAPYDRIILTAAAWDIAPAWWEQLSPHGRLVLPLSLRQDLQASVAFKKADHHLESLSVSWCHFMDLRGACAGPEGRLQLSPEPGLYLFVDDPAQVDADATYALVNTPGSDHPTSLQVTLPEVAGGLNRWLALRVSDYCWLYAEGEWTKRVLGLFTDRGGGQSCASYGLLGERGLCLLSPPPDQPPVVSLQAPFQLFLRSWGAAEIITQYLMAQVCAWEAAGRPTAGYPAPQRLRIRAYPVDYAYLPAANECVIPKRWTRLVLDFPARPASSTEENNLD